MSVQTDQAHANRDIGSTRGAQSSLAAARAIFIVSAVAAAAIGGWAAGAPRSFYRSFPGFGRHWVAALGPYNEHLLRDFGGLNLGLAAASVVAAVALTRSAAICAAAAWLAYSAPHIAFHAFHTGPFTAGDNVASFVSLAASAAAPVTAALLVWRASPRP